MNYRHLRQSYLNNVFGPDHPAYPVVELASRTRMLNLGENPATGTDAQDNPDWMRWNNLGIAYLDQLQYADAMQAFEKVLKLRPDYADGHTNIGLTYIEWEKYSEARPSLEEALKLSPDNARALYYLALVERREGHCEEEMADLEKVVEQYPQVARSHGANWESRTISSTATTRRSEQFEALQAIDPDDLAAHYNLAVLYRPLGMKEKAAEQAGAVRDQTGGSGSADLFAGVSCECIRRFRTRAYPGTCTRIYRHAGTQGTVGRSQSWTGIAASFFVRLSRTALVLPFADFLPGGPRHSNCRDRSSAVTMRSRRRLRRVRSRPSRARR